MSMYDSPLINIPLPPPRVIPGTQLVGLYTCMLGADYLLLRHQLPISKRILRIAIVAAHSTVPLLIVSPFQPNNVAFAVIPWFLASYSAYLPTEHLTLKEWLSALSSTVIDSSSPAKPSEGLWKLIRGATKFITLFLLVEPLLPEVPEQMFQSPYFSSISLINTFLFGIKAYLILGGGSDIMAGVAEIVSGKRIIDMFDSPLLSTSPIDFWSRRWNKHIRNLLHTLIFKDGQSSKWSRGLLTFAVSGLFHELIICSLLRKVTLENLSFFLLHGLTCMVQAACVGRSEPPKGWKRVACILSQLSLMTVTGRLFLSPFLRCHFTEILPLT